MVWRLWSPHRCWKFLCSTKANHGSCTQSRNATITRAASGIASPATSSARRKQALSLKVVCWLRRRPAATPASLCCDRCLPGNPFTIFMPTGWARRINLIVSFRCWFGSLFPKWKATSPARLPSPIKWVKPKAFAPITSNPENMLPTTRLPERNLVSAGGFRQRPQGIGDELRAAIVKLDQLDNILLIDDCDAINMSRKPRACSDSASAFIGRQLWASQGPRSVRQQGYR